MRIIAKQPQNVNTPLDTGRGSLKLGVGGSGWQQNNSLPVSPLKKGSVIATNPPDNGLSTTRGVSKLLRGENHLPQLPQPQNRAVFKHTTTAKHQGEKPGALL